MGADLPDVREPLARNRHQVLVDRDVNLPLYPEGVLPQEFEIGDQAAGDGVFYSYQQGVRPALLHRFEKAGEGRALHDPDPGST